MYYFIWNSVSGKGASAKALPIIEREMKAAGKAFTFLRTEYIGHATHLASSVIDKDCEAIVSVGGDGLLQEIINGIAPRLVKRVENSLSLSLVANDYSTSSTSIDTPRINLGLIPVGNGNDFARAALPKLHESFEKKIETYLGYILYNNKRKIDLLRANDKYSINIANIGLDADTAEYAPNLKKYFGSFSYIVSLVKNIISFKPFAAEVTMNHERRNGLFTLIAMCNGSQYGGGVRIAPDALMHDGKITVCLIHRMTKKKMMIMFPLAIIGQHRRIKEVTFAQCESISIKIPSEYKLCLDGNIFTHCGTTDISIVAAALNFFVPPE
ncbi:MAG: diacylglycerol kinase family lipid kinase [Clostridiales bacterium]|jgi:YegS/Rv2252/BmrU family lipid kinase|nr:diacylglycerol kinase family lipid kinase [Clostridiales bacterium]